jgi:hypothetical protein
VKKIILVKRADGLFCPAYQHDKEIAYKMAYGEHIFQFGGKRNPRAHALAFALARCTLENLPEKYEYWHQIVRDNPHGSSYLFIKALEIEIGMVIPYQRPDGTMGMIPKSISFDEMSQEEFEPLLNLLIRQCSKYLGIDEREMAKNYIAYL